MFGRGNIHGLKCPFCRGRNSLVVLGLQSFNFIIISASYFGHPISFRQWSDRGINTLSDIISDSILRSFQGLKSQYNLPGISFFSTYNSVMPYGNLTQFIKSVVKQGFVSSLYTYFTKCGEKTFASWHLMESWFFISACYNQLDYSLVKDSFIIT